MPVERGNPNVFTVFKGRFECESAIKEMKEEKGN